MVKTISQPVISLLSDFGLDDEYVGVMKGVILSIYSKAVIVDITHHVPPHDIRRAAFLLKSAYPYFPTGSIHVAVVDPGVGGERDILCAKKNGHFFLAPNNGLLTFVLAGSHPADVFQVSNRALFLETISHTFHGRDIFAPVAAHLLKEGSQSQIGPSVDHSQIVVLPHQQPSISPDRKLTGEIITLDRFGNIVTNIDRPTFCNIFNDVSDPRVVIALADRLIHGVSSSYDAVAVGQPLAIFGSRDLLEISINQGNAQQIFDADIGQPVTIRAGHPK